MSTVRSLHKQAMDLAQQALVCRHKGELESAAEQARHAFELEAQAVDLLPQQEEAEPTLAILCQSAASLALQCDEFDKAQRYAARGLAGYPPPNLARELLQLLENISFQVALQQEGLQLEDEELQLSFKGPAVGFGTIFYRDFINSIQKATQLIDRTVQRLMGSAYQRQGRPLKEFRPFTPILATPQPGSFAVTVRLGSRVGGMVPLFPKAEDVIDNVLNGIELVNEAREDDLRSLIKDEAYFVNFVSLARGMAPDGERISTIQFRTRRRLVPLERTREEIKIPHVEESKEPETLEEVVLEGVLDFATSRKGDREIGLTTDDGTEYDIEVKEGLDDLVRSHYGSHVEVAGILEVRGSKRHLLLADISETDL